MIRAILAGGGVVLILSPLVAFLLWQGGGPGRMTSNDAVTIGFVALIGGLLCLYFSRRFPPASWVLTIMGWILGLMVFPMLLDVLAVLLLAVLR